MMIKLCIIILLAFFASKRLGVEGDPGLRRGTRLDPRAAPPPGPIPSPSGFAYFANFATEKIERRSPLGRRPVYFHPPYGPSNPRSAKALIANRYRFYRKPPQVHAALLTLYRRGRVLRHQIGGEYLTSRCAARGRASGAPPGAAAGRSGASHGRGPGGGHASPPAGLPGDSRLKRSGPVRF